MSSISMVPDDLKNASTAVASSLSTSRTAAAGTTGAATTSSTADVTSNDFLTLLVTELKNQDPTQPTDPNAYVQQLTEVNSLQQLIAINQDLSGTGADPAGSSTTTAPVTN